MSALQETVRQGRGVGGCALGQEGKPERPQIVERIVLNKCQGSSNKDYVIQVSYDGEFYYVVVGWGKHYNYGPQQTQRKLKTRSKYMARNTAEDWMYAKTDKGYRQAKSDNQWRIPLRG